MKTPNQSCEQRFAQSLTNALKAYYRGRLPSFSVIARDFALRAPHLKHLSGETVRKWIRGSCLPHFSRMQVLEEWLGVNFNNLDKPTTANGHQIEAYQLNSVEPAKVIHTTDQLSQQVLSQYSINSPTDLVELVRVLHDLSPEQQNNVIIAIESLLKASNFLKSVRDE